MLETELAALAASGGTAVVQAAGTDAWQSLRDAVGRWFGRGGDGEGENAALERLDRTAADVQDAEPGAREAEEARWRSQFTAFLAELAGNERASAAAELSALLDRHRAEGPQVSAGPGSVAAGGDVHISAEGGSIAAGVIQGGVPLPNPRRPDQEQG